MIDIETIFLLSFTLSELFIINLIYFLFSKRTFANKKIKLCETLKEATKIFLFILIVAFISVLFLTTPIISNLVNYDLISFSYFTEFVISFLYLSLFFNPVFLLNIKNNNKVILILIFYILCSSLHVYYYVSDNFHDSGTFHHVVK